MALKILLADDSMTAQNMGKKILVDAGYDVVPVSNGAQALKKIAEQKPQVAILDIYMPGYNGLEVCERLRNAPATAKLPILLTVGKMEPYRPEDGARVGADGFIIKPFEASDLIAAVEKLAEALVPPRVAKPAEVEADEPADEVHAPWGEVSVEVPNAMSSTPAMMDELLPTVDVPLHEEIHAVAGAHEAAFAVAAAAELPPAAPVLTAPIAHAPEIAEFVPAPPPAENWNPAPASEFAVSAGAPDFLLDVPAPVMDLGLVEAAPGVEFTSAPQVGSLKVEQLNELETDLQPEDIVVAGGLDPDLVKDVTRIALDFPTQFGVETPEEVTLGVPEPEIASEFESLVSSLDQPVSDAVEEPAPFSLELGMTGPEELTEELGALEAIGIEAPAAEEVVEDPLSALSAAGAPVEVELSEAAVAEPSTEWTLEEAPVVPGEDDILLEAMTFEETRPTVEMNAASAPEITVEPQPTVETEVAPPVEMSEVVAPVIAEEPTSEALDVFSLAELGEMPGLDISAGPVAEPMLALPIEVADEPAEVADVETAEAVLVPEPEVAPVALEPVEEVVPEVVAHRENPWEMTEAVHAPEVSGSDYAEQWADAADTAAMPTGIAVAEAAEAEMQVAPTPEPATAAPVFDAARVAEVIEFVFERHKAQMIAEILRELREDLSR